MTLLWRIGALWLALGLVAGLVLRGQLPWRRLPQLYLVAALPWLAHLVYTVFFTLNNTSGLGTPLAIFAGSSLVLGTAVLLAAWRAWRPSARLALAPLGLVLAHVAPLLVFSRVLRRAGLGNAGLGMDALPLAIFLGASLFLAGLLFAYSAGRGGAGGPGRGLLARWRRR